ncbi:MAG: hypothetical protein ABIY70_27820 [Capsulimonas sp.]|jgi:hypothetical protein|uniref:hypothetical protein n=1 Tax=Capsulimonas sp. TaxID=2494211 RepID=UPI003264FD4F
MSGYERLYVQCGLQRGSVAQVAWIPQRHAVIGRNVALTEPDKNGWTVISVGAALPEACVMERSRDYRQTRRASDV